MKAERVRLGKQAAAAVVHLGVMSLYPKVGAKCVGGGDTQATVDNNAAVTTATTAPVKIGAIRVPVLINGSDR